MQLQTIPSRLSGGCLFTNAKLLGIAPLPCSWPHTSTYEGFSEKSLSKSQGPLNLWGYVTTGTLRSRLKLFLCWPGYRDTILSFLMAQLHHQQLWEYWSQSWAVWDDFHSHRWLQRKRQTALPSLPGNGEGHVFSPCSISKEHLVFIVQGFFGFNFQNYKIISSCHFKSWVWGHLLWQQVAMSSWISDSRLTGMVTRDTISSSPQSHPQIPSYPLNWPEIENIWWQKLHLHLQGQTLHLYWPFSDLLFVIRGTGIRSHLETRVQV